MPNSFDKLGFITLHGAGGEFAEGFLQDVTKELKIVIGNTKWQGV